MCHIKRANTDVVKVFTTVLCCFSGKLFYSCLYYKLDCSVWFFNIVNVLWQHQRRWRSFSSSLNFNLFFQSLVLKFFSVLLLFFPLFFHYHYSTSTNTTYFNSYCRHLNIIITTANTSIKRQKHIEFLIIFILTIIYLYNCQ